MRLAALGGLLTVLCVTACTPARESRPWKPPAEVPANAQELSRLLERAVGTRLEPGNHAELIQNGHVFDVIAEQVRQARVSVHVLLFIWRPGPASDALVEAISERARAGVTCRILVERLGSRDFRKEVWPRLEQAGCRVRFYKPLTDADGIDEVVERSHHKIVVVDGQVGLTGGFGVDTPWMGDTRNRDEWRDQAILVSGPGVRSMQRAFARSWRTSGGEPLGPEAFPPLRPVGDVLAGFVEGTSHNRGSLRLTHLLIHSARKRLWIANGYFAPSDELLQALLDKKRQGVDVRVMVPGQIHDVRPVLAAQRATYGKLLAGGIPVYEYVATMMHSKAMLVDDDVVVVGSINLDPMSLEQTRDGAMVAVSPELGREMERVWERDLQSTHSVQSPDRSVFQEVARRVFWFIGRTL